MNILKSFYLCPASALIGQTMRVFKKVFHLFEKGTEPTEKREVPRRNRAVQKRGLLYFDPISDFKIL